VKALMKVAPGVGNVEVRDIPEPKPGPGEVMIEVRATGICGTDIHIYDDEFRSYPPVVMGHEISGVVAAVGEGVEGLEIGARVTTETYYRTCEHCRFCRSGQVNLCPERRSLGSAINGGFARYTVVPQRNIHRLPDGISFEAGAVSEPLACCVQSLLFTSRVVPGDLAVISGPGTIGLLTFQLCRAAGARTVVLGTSVDEGRLALAKQLGADRVVNVQQEDALAIVQAMSDGYGADVVCECAGVEASAQNALRLVRRGGRFVQVGLYGHPIRWDLEQVPYKEIIVSGGNASTPASWRRALEMLGQGLVQTEPLISHRLPLTQWEEGFRLFREKIGGKILLIPED